MKELFYILLVIICLGLQVAVVEELRIAEAGPNLLFIVALYAALFAPKRAAVAAAAAAGLGLDIFSSGRFGMYALLFGLMAAALVPLREKTYKEHFLSQAALALFCLGAIGTAAAIWMKAMYPSAELGGMLAAAALTALWTAIVAPFVLAALVRLNRILGFVERRSLAYE